MVGAALFIASITTVAQAQIDDFSRQLVVPQIDGRSAQAPECELLNRTSTVSTEKDGTKSKVIHFVISSNSNAHPDNCLQFEIESACNRSEPVEKIAIEFISLSTGSFYKAGRTYRMSGLCEVSLDPNDVYLVRRPEGVTFERRRHFNMQTDWTERKD